MELNLIQPALMTGRAEAPDKSVKFLEEFQKDPLKEADPLENLPENVFDPEKKKEEKVNPDQAREVARKLNVAMPKHTLRFVVKDPAHVGTDVVIEVLNDKEQVVATIPPKGILGMSQAPNEDAFGNEIKGVLLNASN